MPMGERLTTDHLVAMKKQIFALLAALCVFSTNSPAVAAADNRVAWLFNCEANSCLLAHTIETIEAGVPVSSFSEEHENLHQSYLRSVQRAAGVSAQ